MVDNPSPLRTWSVLWSYDRVVSTGSAGPSVALSLPAGCERRLNCADERCHQAKPDADFGGGCDTRGFIFFFFNLVHFLHQLIKAVMCINCSSDGHQGAAFKLNSFPLYFYLVSLSETYVCQHSF